MSSKGHILTRKQRNFKTKTRTDIKCIGNLREEPKVLKTIDLLT